MKIETPADLVDRISNIDWSTPPKQRKSQALLIQEFLRRTALWSSMLPESGWPFYDYAEELYPEIRALPEHVNQLQSLLDVGLSVFVKSTCEYALHFRAIQQQKIIPFDLPDPFEPIILTFERGSPIRKSQGYFIEVDFLYVHMKTKSEWLKMGPQVELDIGQLDAMDATEG